MTWQNRSTKKIHNFAFVWVDDMITVSQTPVFSGAIVYCRVNSNYSPLRLDHEAVFICADREVFFS
jgi:hypothetical protein